MPERGETTRLRCRWNPTLWITEKGGLYSNSGPDFTIHVLTVLPVMTGCWYHRERVALRIVKILYPSRGPSLRYLRGLLCLDESGHEVVEVGGVDVADSDHAQIGCGGGAEVEAGEGARECGERGAGRSLREEEGDLVLVDGEEEKGRGLAVEVGEVGAFEGGVGGEGGGVGEVKAEGEMALEPGFDGVTVGGDDLGGGCAGEGGQVLVEEFGGECVGLVELAPAEK
jgi:hypothetical protein